jgi:pseudouridine kinase
MFPDQAKRVLVIGSAGLDIVGRTTGPVEMGVSQPANVRTSFGGVSRNIAENLARLGQPVSLISVVGADDFGRRLLVQADSLGIDIHSCLETPDYHTASYLAILSSEGHLQFGLDDMSILSLLTPSYLQKQKTLFDAASLVFVDANLSPATLKTVFKLAEHVKIPVCADTTSSLLATRLIPYLPQLFMVTANMVEANILCESKTCITDPTSGMEAARFLISRGVQVSMIPMGELGVCYATSETNGHIPAISTRVVDPTGAGDALTAAVIYGMLNDMPIDDAIQLGVSSAALTLRYSGTVLPDLSLEKLYSQLVF